MFLALMDRVNACRAGLGRKHSRPFLSAGDLLQDSAASLIRGHCRPDEQPGIGFPLASQTDRCPVHGYQGVGVYCSLHPAHSLAVSPPRKLRGGCKVAFPRSHCTRQAQFSALFSSGRNIRVFFFVASLFIWGGGFRNAPSPRSAIFNQCAWHIGLQVCCGHLRGGHWGTRAPHQQCTAPFECPKTQRMPEQL